MGDPATKAAWKKAPYHEWENVWMQGDLSGGQTARMKVPGGWLYRHVMFDTISTQHPTIDGVRDTDDRTCITMVFVPVNP